MKSRVVLSRRDMLRDATLFSGTVLACDGLAQTSIASQLQRAQPEELQIDARRLQVAFDLLEHWTTGPQPPVPGAAIIVGRHGKTLPPRYFGRQGPEPDAEPLRKDAMFYMASVTKPVIFMAGMLLVERGRLNLSDLVTRYVPDFTGGGKEHSQILHLFTHTSGLPDELPNNAVLRREQVPLSRFIEEVIKTPLLFGPGTQFSYSSSGTILMAEVIQRISGQTIHEFVRDEILRPLGLQSTGLGSAGFARERLVRTTIPEYQHGSPGNWNSQYWQELGSPAGGLFSTPDDYAVICAMMLGGGQWNGARLLAPATVRMMTSNRLHDLPDLPEPVRRTQPWGLGWRLNHLGRPDSWSDLLSRRVFGHTGSAGNIVWMNPDTQGFCIVLSNYLRARAPWRLVHISNAVAAAFL